VHVEGELGRILLDLKSAFYELSFRLRYVQSTGDAFQDFFSTIMEMRSVYKVASSIATGVSPASAAIAKRQLYSELLRGDVGDAIEDSKRLIGEFMKKPDYKEGVAALLEGRPPRFPPSR
jgi:hypothetical protein